MQKLNFKNLKKTFVIAEIGNNHEGKISIAKKLIRLAAKAKVDAVKFQTFKTEEFIKKKDNKRFNQIKKFELKKDQFIELKEFAHKNKLFFISTPLDLQSADFLLKNSDIIKIASSDNNFFPMIDKIISSEKNIIISTGMLNLQQIKYLKKRIRKSIDRNKALMRIAFLHCVTSYPVEDKYANLQSINFLKDNLDYTIGYSDHTLGIDASIASVALGAKIVEKHFTIDKKFSNFRDHALSADFLDLDIMVKKIRKIELLLGSYKKEIQKTEKIFLNSTRRGIYAKENLFKGERITQKKVSFLRDKNSADFFHLDSIIGKKLNQSAKKGQKITKNKLI